MTKWAKWREFKPETARPLDEDTATALTRMGHGGVSHIKTPQYLIRMYREFGKEPYLFTAYSWEDLLEQADYAYSRRRLGTRFQVRKVNRNDYSNRMA